MTTQDDAGDAADAARAGASLCEVEPASAVSSTAAIPIALRVWWIPQVPMEAFLFPVPTIEAGLMLCDALAKYDLFQFEKRVKPDYCNMGGLSWCHPVLTEGEWWDIDPDDEYEVGEIREALARGGVTEGRDAAGGLVRSEATNSTRSPQGDAPAQGDGG